MLIDHDFDWEEDLDESYQPAAAGVPGPTSTPCRAGSSSAPSPEIVIIQRHHGFSPGILALAIVALILSATTKLFKTSHPNPEPIIHRTAIPTERRPHEQADPGGSSTDGVRRATEVGRGKPARRDHLRKEAGSLP